MSVWQTGDVVGPTNLNARGGSATTLAGFSTNTLAPESGNTISLGTFVLSVATLSATTVSGALIGPLSTNTIAPQSGSTISIAGATVLQSLDSGGMVFNVKAFGAAGNGTVDDTSAVSKAMSAASNVGSGVVYFPAGKYALSNLPVVTQPIVLLGSGMSSILSSTATTGNFLQFNYGGSGNTVNHLFGPGLRNLYMIGSGPGSAVTGILLGGAAGAEGFYAENLRIDKFGSGIVYGDNTWFTTYNHCMWVNCNQMVLVPSTANNTGEGLLWLNSAFANASPLGNDVQISLAGCDARMIATSFDNAQFTITNGRADLFACQFENPGAAGNYDMISAQGGTLALYGATFQTDSVNTWTNTELVLISGCYVYAEGVNSVCNRGTVPQIFTVSSAATLCCVGVRNLFNTTKSVGTTGTPGAVVLLGGIDNKNYFQDGTATFPSQTFFSESSLGFYRSSSSNISMSYGTLSVPTIAAGSGTVSAPSHTFSSEVSLGFLRSTASQIKLSYGVLDTTPGTISAGTINAAGAVTLTNTGTGQLLYNMSSGNQAYVTANSTSLDIREGTGGLRVLNNSGTTANWTFRETGAVSAGNDGTVSLPMFTFNSELSLGLTRSAASTLALSYGTLSLNQAYLASVKTATSINSTVLGANAIAIANPAVSGASICININGVMYIFNSSATTIGK